MTAGLACLDASGGHLTRGGCGISRATRCRARHAIGTSGCYPRGDNTVGEAFVNQWKLAAKLMLVAFNGRDFVNGEVEFKREAVNGVAGIPHELKLGIAESTGLYRELGVEAVAINLADATESVVAVNNVAVPAVIHGSTGIRHVAEDERAGSFILEANSYVNDFEGAKRAGAKVGDRGGKIGNFVTKRRGAADSRILSCGGALRSARRRRRRLRLRRSGRCKRRKSKNRRRAGKGSANGLSKSHGFFSSLNWAVSGGLCFAAPVAEKAGAVVKFRSEPGLGPPSPLPTIHRIAASHYAMRKRKGKTVMLLENNRAGGGSAEVRAGSAGRGTLDHLFCATYEELRRLASNVRRGDPSATLTPTVLVNEAWLKLAKAPDFTATSRLHFKRIAARAMRQILVEAARRRKAAKRGAEPDITVTFDTSVQEKPACGQELLTLDTALEELGRMNPRQATMVELRFFGGLDVAETAELLAVSEATVQRDWRAAKAWLAHELQQAR